MGEAAENLNYDCNYNMFLAKIMLSNLARSEDRQKAVKWMKKLATCNRSIEEMKLRNDFMYYLVINIQQGELQAPFTDNPPASPLPNIAHLLVLLEWRGILLSEYFTRGNSIIIVVCIKPESDKEKESRSCRLYTEIWTNPFHSTSSHLIVDMVVFYRAMVETMNPYGNPFSRILPHAGFTMGLFLVQPHTEYHFYRSNFRMQIWRFLQPGGVAEVEVNEFGETTASSQQTRKPLLYENSPDGGAFLAAQPVPRCGAFCYLAVVAREPKHD